MRIPLEHAYREACTALGETVVQQRLLLDRVQHLEAQVPSTPPQPPEAPTPSPSAPSDPANGPTANSILPCEAQ